MHSHDGAQHDERPATRLWIGGTSGLTLTYMNEFVVKNRVAHVQPNKKEVITPFVLTDSTPPIPVRSNNKRNLVEDYTSFCNDDIPWIIMGRSSSAPDWMKQDDGLLIQRIISYISLDLTQLSSRVGPNENSLLGNIIMKRLSKYRIIAVVISIRPPLVTYRTNVQAWLYCNAMLMGLETLLKDLLEQQRNNLQLIVNVSSIAAVDHIREQRMYSIRNNSDFKSIDLKHSYDRFKRRTEEIVEEIVSAANATAKVSTKHNHTTSSTSNNAQIVYTNIRVGAFFSDSSKCIQCSALALQMLTGPYLPISIDCNSALNISHMIHLILLKQRRGYATTNSDQGTISFQTIDGEDPHKLMQQPFILRPVYFYTRPLHLLNTPVAYGTHLIYYRLAYNVNFLPLVVPYWFVKWFVVWPLQVITVMVSPFLSIPYLESINYLMQVTTAEHTFDLSETHEDFPELLHLEESILECFLRRKQMLFEKSQSKRNIGTVTSKKQQ